MDFDCIFTYFLPLLEKDDIRAKTTLLQILKIWRNEMVTSFYKKLDSILWEQTEEDLIIKTKRIEKIEAILLDAIYEIENIFHSFKYEILDDLGVRYLKYSEKHRDLSGEKKYLKQAIHYSLLCAIKSDDLRIKARERLITIITTEDAYDIYYSFLMPFLEVGNKKAQDLFNEVAYAVPKAFERFDEHFLKLSQKGEVTKIQDIAITRILREYPQFLRNKRGGNSTIGAFSPNSLMALGQPNKISTPSFVAGEPCIVGSYAGLTDEEEKLPPKALYMLGVKNINKNNNKAICAFLKADESGNKEASRKLTYYRTSKIYKDGETTNKPDSIEHSLYKEDKDRGNLVTFEKKESKVLSPSVEAMKSPPISSHGKQGRRKNIQKEKSESVSTAIPMPTPSKKERRLQKSKLLENLENTVNNDIVESSPPHAAHLESVSTLVLETPQLKESGNKIPVIKEPKVNKNYIDLKPEPAFLVSNKGSSGSEHKISQSAQEKDRRIKKTLSPKPKLERRNSEATIESYRKSSSKPPLRRAESVRNLAPSTSKKPTNPANINVKTISKDKSKDMDEKNNDSQKKLKCTSWSYKKIGSQTKESSSISSDKTGSTSSSEKSRNRSSSTNNESYEISSEESKKLRRVSSRNSLMLHSEESSTNELQETLIQCGELPNDPTEYFPRHNRLLITILNSKFSLDKDEQETLKAIFLGSDDKVTLQISDIKNLFVKFKGFTKGIKKGKGGHEKILGMGITLNPNIDDKPGAYSGQIDQLRASIIKFIVPTLMRADMPS
jgi:hypothetical protein